ncbi:MAG: hypothetical protein KatS3mg082_3267 [Nitrospiraceae bacterium]|nr:MAG: hypothetical protein KatS3mg081_1378 [Gemmatimonadales bacterium]GIW56863.1 MAG: hypothetical protein KatS3mg082_3267 [Nitrospiraceae bacterium]
MSFEPRDYLRHILVEIDYLLATREGLTFEALTSDETLRRAFVRSLEIIGEGKRITKSELVPPVAAVGPLGFSVEPCYRPGLVRIGDSAGFLDPITGDGMTLALKSVKAAVPLIKEAFASGDFGAALGQRYERERFHVVQDVFRFTRLLPNLSRYRFVADRAIRRLSGDQRLFQKLLGVVTGSHRHRGISLHEKAALVME